jgi:hypothetical protein
MSGKNKGKINENYTADTEDKMESAITYAKAKKERPMDYAMDENEVKEFSKKNASRHWEHR